MTFVIPRFADIFRDLGSAIPWPTQVLMAVSGWLTRYWWALAGGTLAIALLLRAWVATAAGRLRADELILGVPVLGAVVLQTEVARFARITGTLLKSGVPMLAALGVVKEMMGNLVLARAVDGLADGVRRGAGLSRPMDDSHVFPALATHMVRVGEETGRLEDMLLKVGATFETDTRKRVKRLIALVEPAIILVMGLVVAFIVVAMLMAILSITDIAI